MGVVPTCRMPECSSLSLFCPGAAPAFAIYQFIAKHGTAASVTRYFSLEQHTSGATLTGGKIGIFFDIRFCTVRFIPQCYCLRVRVNHCVLSLSCSSQGQGSECASACERLDDENSTVRCHGGYLAKHEKDEMVLLLLCAFSQASAKSNGIRSCACWQHRICRSLNALWHNKWVVSNRQAGTTAIFRY